MSILGAIQAQTGTLTELSKLPQALIMQMAQKGQIGKDMVMPILAKKAEMVEAARAMRNAQQGGVPPSTVLEQIMEKNTEAEQPAPQMAQAPQMQQPPQERGIETLDTGRMNPEQYAGGGIVAFEGGGEVPGYAGPTGSVVGMDPAFQIDPQVQAQRDETRRQILLQELQRAQAQGNAADVAMLQREISRMKPAPTFASKLRAGVESLIPSAQAATVSTPAGKSTARVAPVVDDAIYDPMTGALISGTAPTAPSTSVGITDFLIPGRVEKIRAAEATQRAKAEAEKSKPATQTGIAAVPTPPTVSPQIESGLASLAEKPKEEPMMPPVEVNPTPEIAPELKAPVFKPELLTGRGFDTTQDRARADEFATAYGVDPDYFKKQRDKLEAEGAEIPKEKEQAKWMALAEAGLAIAAGDSPYALQNIAKGGGKGLEAYKGYQKDIKEKQRLLRDRDARINEAEQFEKRGQSTAAIARREKAMEHDDRIAEINAKAMAEAEKANLNATFAVQKTLWDRYNLTEDEQVKANREIMLQGARDKAAMERVIATVAGQKEVAAIGIDKLDKIPAKDLARIRQDVELNFGPQIKKALQDKYGSNANIDAEYRRQLEAKVNSLTGASAAPTTGFRLLPD